MSRDDDLDAKIRYWSEWVRLTGTPEYQSTVQEHAKSEMARLVTYVLSPPKDARPDEVERARGAAHAWSAVSQFGDNAQKNLTALLSIRDERLNPPKEELVSEKAEDRWYENTPG